MSNKRKTEFLIVGSKKANAFTTLFKTLGVPFVTTDLDDFISMDAKPFRSLLFMPEYFEWDDDFSKKELILKKIKRFTDNGGNLYAEYVQCDDYILRKVFLFSIKQNHPPRPVALERIVVTDNHYITSEFSRRDILPVRDCVFLPCHPKGSKTILSFAVVLGAHKVVHGMPPKRDVWPALMANDEGGIFATFELSKYTEKDFPLQKRWDNILKRIVLFLMRERQRARYRTKLFPVEILLNKPGWAALHDKIKIKTDKNAEITVSASGLPGPVPVNTLKRSNSLQFVPEKEGTYVVSARQDDGSASKQEIVISQRDSKYREVLDNLIKWYFESGVMPKKDGSSGVYEGFRSTDHKLIPIFRSDCNVTTAETMFLYGQLTKNDFYKKVARNIFEFLLREGHQDLNSNHSTYGLWKFYTDYCNYPLQIFCNDNSWVTMALFNLYRWTGEKDYSKHALLTVQNIYESRLLEKGLMYIHGDDLVRLGVKGYWNHIKSRKKVSNLFVPTMYVYAYKNTGDAKYLRRAEQYIDPFLKKTVSDAAHLNLVSLLHAVTGKDEYRDKIDSIMRNVKKTLPPYRMSEYSEYMRMRKGSRIKRTNSLYGIGEVDARHNTKDPIVDQLYMTSRMAMYIYTAYEATGNEEYLQCFYRQMDFLARIQIRSTDKRLNGAWMRSFDYENWDYYGSNGDIDWGPYCVESGWGNTWTGRALLHYLLKETVI